MAVVLLVFHYAVEFLYHLCRMLHYYGKSQLANPGYNNMSGALTAVSTPHLSLPQVSCVAGTVHLGEGCHDYHCHSNSVVRLGETGLELPVFAMTGLGLTPPKTKEKKRTWRLR